MEQYINIYNDNNNILISPRYSSIESKKYRISQKMIMDVETSRFTDIETDIIWQTQPLQQRSQIILKELQRNAVKIPTAFTPTIQFLSQFNEPIVELQLAINENGTINNILNQHEIEQKWQHVKHRILSSQTEPDELLDSIINKGDSDYQQTLPMLLNTPIYQVFFPALLGSKYLEPRSSGTINTHSHFIPENVVKLELSECIKIEDNGTITIKYRGTNKPLDLKQYTDNYEQVYSQMTSAKFDYLFSIKADYHYLLGEFSHGQIEYIEQLSETVRSKHIYTIIPLIA